jgi:hypothetical protein
MMSNQMRETRFDMRSRNTLRFACAVVLAAGTLTGCAAGSTTGSARPTTVPAAGTGDVAGWSALKISGDEVEGYKSFDEMFASADRVVVGRFTSFAPGRTIQGDATDDVVRMIDGEFRIEEPLKGEGSTLTVEFLGGSADEDEAKEDAARIQSAAGSNTTVLFLRNKAGKGEEGLIRLVNSYGLVTSTDRAPVDVPLGEVPEGPAESAQAGEVAGVQNHWKTIEEFIDDLR